MLKIINKSKIIFFVCCSFLTVFSSAFAESVGNINWNEGFVEAVGEGVAKPSGSKAKDRISARRAAEVKAQRALLETIKGVHVTSITTVQDSMLTDDVIKTRVDGIVKGAYVVSDKFEWESDGSALATVVMRICLLGGTSCKGTPLVQVLALDKIPEPAFVPKKILILDTTPQASAEPPSKPIAEVPRLAVITPVPPTPEPALAPPVTAPVTAPSQTAATAPVPVPAPVASYSCDLTKQITGVIFSLEGKFYERVLLPVVISESGSGEPVKVYSAKLVKPSVFRTFGAIRYADSVDNAAKQIHVCGNVLVVPVKDITKENMIVINARDVAKIKETLAHGNNYLEDAKVVISAQ